MRHYLFMLKPKSVIAVTPALSPVIPAAAGEILFSVIPAATGENLFSVIPAEAGTQSPSLYRISPMTDRSPPKPTRSPVTLMTVTQPARWL